MQYEVRSPERPEDLVLQFPEPRGTVAQESLMVIRTLDPGLGREGGVYTLHIGVRLPRVEGLIISPSWVESLSKEEWLEPTEENIGILNEALLMDLKKKYPKEFRLVPLFAFTVADEAYELVVVA